jgi:hypothetical protein
VLQETFNWKSLSIIGGLALWRFYFQIHNGSIKSPQVIEFLQHLQRISPERSWSFGTELPFIAASWSKATSLPPAAAFWLNACPLMRPNSIRWNETSLGVEL